MSRPFANFGANPTFAKKKTIAEAGDYIKNKKAIYSLCTPNICHPNKNIYSQNNYLLLKQANKLKFYPDINKLNYSQLYANLYTKLDLSGVPVLYRVSTGTTTPVIIDPNDFTVYKTYKIDPKGFLFGNTPCGLYNFENYVVYNPPYSTSNPGCIVQL